MTKKIVFGVVGLLVVGTGGAVGFGLVMKPAQRPAPQITVDLAPDRVARGRYLANNVFPCMHCHSQTDLTLYGGFARPGTEGAGGQCMGREMGIPGVVCPRNITPDRETGIGAWTDGEIVRAIREGVDREGKGLFPVMPYEAFREMPDEDAFAIVAYLRSLPPIQNKVPRTQIDFPVSIFAKLTPQPLTGAVAPIARSDRTAYGHYLTRACYLCHTPTDARHQPLADRAFGGGREFVSQDLVNRSANLTFDETGQGARTKEQFIAMFSVWRGVAAPKVAPRDNTFMPWHAFSGMTDEDLGTVYDFLKAQPNISNKVDRRPLAAPASAPTAAAP